MTNPTAYPVYVARHMIPDHIASNHAYDWRKGEQWLDSFRVYEMTKATCLPFYPVDELW